MSPLGYVLKRDGGTWPKSSPPSRIKAGAPSTAAMRSSASAAALADGSQLKWPNAPGRRAASAVVERHMSRTSPFASCHRLRWTSVTCQNFSTLGFGEEERDDDSDRLRCLLHLVNDMSLFPFCIISFNLIEQLLP